MLSEGPDIISCVSEGMNQRWVNVIRLIITAVGLIITAAGLIITAVVLVFHHFLNRKRILFNIYSHSDLGFSLV